MKFYAFWKPSDPVILLLPGTCCHWKLNFGEVIPLLHKIVSTGEYPKILQGMMEKKRTPYRDKFMAMFGIGNGGLLFMKLESVYNQFYSDLITPLEDQISVCSSGSEMWVRCLLRMAASVWCCLKKGAGFVKASTRKKGVSKSFRMMVS